MKHFKTFQAVGQALADGGNPAPLSAVLSLLLSLHEGFSEYGGWIPDEHGWAVLLEAPGDLDDLDGLHLGGPFIEAPFEEVSHRSELRCFVATVIMSNDFGLSYVVPETILSPELRAALEAESRPSAPAC
jgi:hypothetical protein